MIVFTDNEHKNICIAGLNCQAGYATEDIVIGVNQIFTVCVAVVFDSNYVKFRVICSYQYGINITKVEVETSLKNGIVKPKLNEYQMNLGLMRNATLKQVCYKL